MSVPSLYALLCRLVVWMTLVVVSTGVGASAGATPSVEPLRLEMSRPAVDAWPAVRLLADPGGALDWRSALARLPEFTAPRGAARNLGVQRQPVWLALALSTADGDGRWIVDLEYAPLNDVQVFLVTDGQRMSQAALGARLPFEARQLHTRTHAAMLSMVPGQSYWLLLRVQTDSSMLLPLTLSTPDAYHQREAGRAVMQGLMFGFAWALLAYSFVNGISVRSSVFALYGAMLLGSLLFFLDFSGLGQQFLWSRRVGLVEMISPLSVLLAMAAGALFVMRAVQTQVHSPRLHWGLAALSGTAAVVLALGLLGALTYRQAQFVATVIGPLVPLIAITVSWQLARRGERIGQYMLLGWGCYCVGSIGTVLLLRGLLPTNFWTLHMYQWASLLEMLAWMRVLGLHVEALRDDSERNAAAVQDLSVIARTDALTGLPNRRGLDVVLRAALARADERRLTGVFLTDLDGFKAVNDTYGHAVGDKLLVEVGRRLAQGLRRSDVVARLGGDEFVIVAEDLQSAQEAEGIGRKLLDVFNDPVVIDGKGCDIGLTIGYVVAPLDGDQLEGLLSSADAAMYAGKRAGRHQLRRGRPPIGCESAPQFSGVAAVARTRRAVESPARPHHAA